MYSREHLLHASRHIYICHSSLTNGVRAALCMGLVSAMMELYNHVLAVLLPTPSRFHYLFNPRDLSRVLEGLLLSTPAHFTAPDAFVRLWRNECLRIFHDRLICDEDKQAGHTHLPSTSLTLIVRHSVRHSVQQANYVCSMACYCQNWCTLQRKVGAHFSAGGLHGLRCNKCLRISHNGPFLMRTSKLAHNKSDIIAGHNLSAAPCCPMDGIWAGTSPAHGHATRNSVLWIINCVTELASCVLQVVQMKLGQLLQAHFSSDVAEFAAREPILFGALRGIQVRS